MARANGHTGLRLAGARELLLPFTVMLCFALYYLAHAPRWTIALVALPMAACYALGEDAEAIRVYRGLLSHATALPGVRHNLAFALVRRGEALREALELIDRDADGAPAPERLAELDLLRAVAHAKLGERERA